MGIIYKVTCPRGLVYIGQCKRKGRKGRKLSPWKQMKLRWNEHCLPDSGCRTLASAIKRFGKQNMNIEILVVVPDKMLNDMERCFVKMYDSNDKRFGYNGTEGGEGGGFAIESVRERMLQPDSAWRKAQSKPDVVQKKLSKLNAAREKDPSIEVRRKKLAADSQTRRLEERIASLPVHEQEEARHKALLQKGASARHRARKKAGIAKTYRKPKLSAPNATKVRQYRGFIYGSESESDSE